MVSSKSLLRRKTMGKLQDQMKTDLVLKGYSPHTIRQYLHCIRNFAKYFNAPAAEMAKPKYAVHALSHPGTQSLRLSCKALMSMPSSFIRTTLRHPQVVEHLLTQKTKTFPKSSPCRKFSPLLRRYPIGQIQSPPGNHLRSGLRISEACRPQAHGH